MAITWISANQEGSWPDNATAVSVSPPSGGSSGRLAVFFVYVYDDVSATPTLSGAATGMTALGSVTNPTAVTGGGTGLKIWVYAKILTGSESGDYVATTGVYTEGHVHIADMGGATSYAYDIDGDTGVATDASVDAPSVDATAAGSLLIMSAAGGNSGLAQPLNAPSGMTQRVALSNAHYSWTQDSIASGATGSRSATENGGGADYNTDWASAILVISPVAGGGGSSSDPIESAGRRQLRQNAIYRMTPENDARAQKVLRARRAYGFASALP